MRSFKVLIFCLLAGSFAVSIHSCRKNDRVDSSPGLHLEFSTDTVFFDTVFPTVGSVTRRLVVYNTNKGKVNIESIRLAGGEASNYRINISGVPALTAANVEIPGGDSIYIFIRVTIDPHNQSTPFVVSDSLEFNTNGTFQQVQLAAWGREAVFHQNETLQGNAVWDSLRAHVIYGFLRVDTSSVLTILPGTKVYFHFNSYMAVSFQSTLKIPGTLEHPVRMQGDRLDPFYKDLPGQWRGIDLEPGSRGHEMNHTYIRNGTYGIAVDSLGLPGMPMLLITNSIIQNMTAYGIYAYGSNIKAVNLVLGDCGRSCLSVNYGGEYDFSYLTIGNYWSASVRQSASVYLSNYSYDLLGGEIVNPLSRALFTNAIIYGSNEDEIRLDSLPSAQFEYTFDHAILKTGLKTTNTQRFINCTTNVNPRFSDPNNLDYRIDSISPAIKAAKDIGVPFDIRGQSRGNEPALGAYEYVKGDRH